MVANVRNTKCKEPEDNSNNTTSDNIHGVVEVVTDPSEGYPESKNGDTKLHKGPNHLENLYTSVHKFQGGFWELVEPCLEVEDKEGGTVKAEGTVPRHKRHPGILQHLFCCISLHAQADQTIIEGDKNWVSMFIFADLICVSRLT